MSVELVRQGIEMRTVVLCQAFNSEETKSEQQANCYELNRHTRRASSTDEGIVFLGLGELECDASGNWLRPDLRESRDEAQRQRSWSARGRLKICLPLDANCVKSFLEPPSWHQFQWTMVFERRDQDSIN